MLAAILKGLVLGLLLSVSVGPVIFTIIKKSLRNGHKAAYYFVAGVSLSDCTFVLLANVFSALFAKALQHQSTIAVLGSIFLIGLGCYNIFFKKTVTDAELNIEENTIGDYKNRKAAAANIVSGYLMNLLNPGAFLFWFVWSAAILTDSLHTPHPLQYRVLVFSTCLIIVLASDLLKVLLAGKLRSKLTASNIHNLDLLNGIILLVFGVALFFMYFNK